MFFTILFTLAATTVTIKLAAFTAYEDSDGHKYAAYEPYNSIPSKIKKEAKVVSPPVTKSVSLPRASVAYDPQIPTVVKHSLNKPFPRTSPIKMCNGDPYFMKNIKRICALETLSNRSVLDMYDTDPLFGRFPELKGFARNLTWEMAQRTQRTR